MSLAVSVENKRLFKLFLIFLFVHASSDADANKNELYAKFKFLVRYFLWKNCRFLYNNSFSVLIFCANFDKFN